MQGTKKKTSRKRAKGSYHDPAPIDDEHDTVRTRAETISSRKRLQATDRVTQRVDASWSSGDSWLPVDDSEYGLSAEAAWFDDEDQVVPPLRSPSPVVQSRPRRSLVSRRPQVVWMESYRDSYLDELIRWDGRGDFYSNGIALCSDCVSSKSQNPGYADHRCTECYTPLLTCKTCCIRRHRMNPFHCIEVWSGTHFKRTSLKHLGLRIQLNHLSNSCSNPEPCHTDFRVLHTNGIHEVALDFCGCERAIPKHVQLLRRKLFPATQTHPRTTATFALLKSFHLLNLTSKISAYDYYKALERLTYNSGGQFPKSRYRALMRMALQWRHLKLLKRAGRGHDPSGVMGTKAGELAIMCPTCPRPGINIPDDWKETPPERRFLYALIICMDANFRLKNQLVSNYSADPGLGIGWAYMVPRKPYEKYVLSQANEEDVSSCVGFQALAQANTRSSVGLRYTGVNMVSCARSEMILPCAVGNLHHGERYSNMDYIYGSAIYATALLLVIISYDVACQWFKNLFARIDNSWPEEIKPSPQLKMCPKIPKLHEPAHERTEHEQYSLNYAPGVGKTDAEAPERIWSGHNGLANSTKTQAPGSRHGVLDDHFAFWNWEKVASMGKTLIRRYKAAVEQRNLQVEGHRGFTNTLDKEIIEEWEAVCEVWEADDIPKKAKNPYHTEGLNLTEAQVRKELADAEKARIGNGAVVLHTTSPAEFMSMGLELEEAQLRLHRRVKAYDKTTAHQEASITEQRNTLRSKITNWQRIQTVYMPGLLGLRQELQSLATVVPPPNEAHQPENLHLWLPSSIPSNLRRAACVEDLPKYEEKLRTAQCYDTLEKIRHVLRVKSRMVHFKNKNVRGQASGTRSRTIINRVQERAAFLSQHYRLVREAKLKLSGPGSWENQLRILHDGDVRSYQDPERVKKRTGRRGTLEDEQLERVDNEAEEGGVEGIDLMPEIRDKRAGTGETRRLLSWIWLVERRDGAFEGMDKDDDDDILRSEWAKSRARAHRAKEEVMMLREEMRRLIEFLSWKARWWSERQVMRLTLDNRALAEGIVSYAVRQGNVQQDLRTSFQALFKTPLEDVDNVTNDDADEEDDVDGNQDPLQHVGEEGIQEDDDMGEEATYDEEEEEEEHNPYK